MDRNIEFLNYIHQNAEMGKDTLSELISIVKDEPLKKVLESQLKEYTEIFDLTNKKIEQTKETSKGIGTFSKVTAYLMINFNTMTNKTPSHIAEMLIEGSTKGIVDITKGLKKFKDTYQDITAIGNKLLKFEQQNVDELKKFL